MKNSYYNTLLIIGIVLLATPALLYWWIHGDYDRYLTIINGPFPFSHLGGGPFQLVVYGGLFLLGIVVIDIWFVVSRD